MSFWELDLAPLEGQWILLTTETASLQLQELIMASMQVPQLHVGVTTDTKLKGVGRI